MHHPFPVVDCLALDAYEDYSKQAGTKAKADPLGSRSFEFQVFVSGDLTLTSARSAENSKLSISNGVFNMRLCACV